MDIETLPSPASAVTSDYTALVDRVTEREWHELLPLFSDANIYQTWAYGTVSWGQKNLSHLVLKKGETVVGLAQFRILSVPLLSTGVAYLRWGPLYRKHGAVENSRTLPMLMAAIKREYAYRRRLLVRIVPSIFRDDPDAAAFETVCAETGFKSSTTSAPYRTIRVELAGSLEELRRRLDQKWRNQLNAAERNGLKIMEGTDDALFQRFSGIYKDMLKRKQFETTVDVDEFGSMQRSLPERMKMLVLLCEKEGKLMAGVVGTALGKTGIYLLGATSADGMKAKGSYLLQWRMMQLLRERGCQWYDLGGINPERNPGVYHFKSGFGGQEAFRCDRLELSGSRWSSACVFTGEKLKGVLASVRAVVHPHFATIPR